LRAKQEEAEDGDADDGGDDRIGEAVDEDQAAMFVMLKMHCGDEAGFAQDVVAICRAPADIAGPDGGVPDTDCDLNAVGARLVRARLPASEWNQLVVPVEGGEDVRRHVADRGDNLAVHEGLPGSHGGREIERQRLVSRGNQQAEAVPGEAAHAGVALLGPRLIAAQQGPGRVVETRFRPARIIAGVEAP
jgi:hypothetical protein